MRSNPEVSPRERQPGISNFLLSLYNSDQPDNGGLSLFISDQEAGDGTPYARHFIDLSARDLRLGKGQRGVFTPKACDKS